MVSFCRTVEQVSVATMVGHSFESSFLLKQGTKTVADPLQEYNATRQCQLDHLQIFCLFGHRAPRGSRGIL